MMLSFLKHKEKFCILYAPVNGRSIPIETVNDQMFAEKMLGDGIAFTFDDDTVYAPCSGQIIMITPTLHSFGIKTQNEMEVLVHIGLDTVNLNGKGLSLLCAVGDFVTIGAPIVKIDCDYMRKNNIDLTTPMIITNGEHYDLDINHENAVVKIKESIVITSNRKT